MAFVAVSDTALARDLWPNGIGRLASDGLDIGQLPQRRVVPRAYEDLFEWLCVDAGSGQVTNVWVHPDLTEGKRMQLVLRLQGIVDSVNLGVLGDWNGEVLGAPKAKQCLTLTGAHFSDAFMPQVEAVNNIKDAVLKLLGRSGDLGRAGQDVLQLERRVFTKVGSLGSNLKAVTLTRTEDPFGRAARMQRMWAVERRIAASAVREGGNGIETVNPLSIKTGDFVDVAVGVQAISVRARQGRRTEVMLVPLHVVRLRTAAQMNALADVMYGVVSDADDGGDEGGVYETGFEGDEGDFDGGMAVSG